MSCYGQRSSSSCLYSSYILRLHIISDMIFDDGTWWWTIDLAQRRKEEQEQHIIFFAVRCGLTDCDRPGGYRMTTSQKPDRLRLVSFFSFLLATVTKGLRRRRRRRYNHTAPITDDTTMFPFFPPLFQRLYSCYISFFFLSRLFYFLLKADMLPSCGAGASSAKWWTWDRMAWGFC